MAGTRMQTPRLPPRVNECKMKRPIQFTANHLRFETTASRPRYDIEMRDGTKVEEFLILQSLRASKSNWTEIVNMNYRFEDGNIIMQNITERWYGFLY